MNSKIEDKRRELAINEICVLASKFYKIDEVECAYLVPYMNDGESVYELSIIYQNSVFGRNSLVKMYRFLTSWYKQKENIDKFGGRIVVGLSSVDKFHEGSYSLQDLRVIKDIASSIIIFDKTGKCTEAAHQNDFYDKYEKYDSLITLDKYDMEVLNYINKYAQKQSKRRKRIKDDYVFVNKK